MTFLWKQYVLCDQKWLWYLFDIAIFEFAKYFHETCSIFDGDYILKTALWSLNQCDLSSRPNSTFVFRTWDRDFCVELCWRLWIISCAFCRGVMSGSTILNQSLAIISSLTHNFPVIMTEYHSIVSASSSTSILFQIVRVFARTVRYLSASVSTIFSMVTGDQQLPIPHHCRSWSQHWYVPFFGIFVFWPSLASVYGTFLIFATWQATCCWWQPRMAT